MPTALASRLGRHRAVPLVVGAACLAAIVYASAHPSSWVWNMPDWTFGPVALPEHPVAPVPTMPPGAPSDATPSPVVRDILIGIGILAVLAIVVLVVRFTYRAVRELVATRITASPARDQLDRAATVPGSPLTPHEVQDAVAEALRRLDEARGATDAIILAWLAFEDAASRHGQRRDPAQTPTEFTVGLLDRSAVPVADTVGLRTLYLRTRFSDIPATAADVAHARAWLEHIARALDEGA